MITALLNKTVDIYRINKPLSANSYGEISRGSEVRACNDLKCRITTVVWRNPDGSEQKFGESAALRYVAFFETTADVRVGDVIKDNANPLKIWHIDTVDKEPGGRTDSHIECYVTSVSHEEVS